MFLHYNLLEDEIDRLKEELNKARQENLEIKAELNTALKEERKRIDALLKDIKEKFESYYEELKHTVGVMKAQEPVFKLSKCNNKSKVKSIEYVDIRIEPLHLRFVKGEEF